MKACAKCGAAMKDGELFCGECGTRQEQQPKQGTGKLKEGSGGLKEKEEETGITSKFLSELFRKKKRLGVAVLAAVAVICGGTILFAAKTGRAPEYVVYCKKNTAFQHSLTGKKSLELTDHATENKSPFEIMYSINNIRYSKDGNYVFYTEKADGNGYGTLMCKNLKKQSSKRDTSEKLDSDTAYIQLLSSGKVLYIKNDTGDRDLYLNDLKSKTKIGSDISNYIVSKDQSCLIYTTSDGGLYTYDLAKKGASKEKLDSDAAYIGASDDLNYIYYTKDNRLMCIKDRKNIEKIASGFQSDGTYKLNGHSLYYLIPVDTYQVTGFITDDRAAKDALLQRPSRSDYRILDGTDRYGLPHYAYDYDKYDAAVDAYNKKLKRDEIRDKLNNAKDITINELYLYDGKTSTKISDSVGDIVKNWGYAKDGTAPAICVSQFDMGKLKKYNLSDFDSSYGVTDQLDDWKKGAIHYSLVTGTVISPFDVDKMITSSAFDYENRIFYYTDGTGKDIHTSLYSIPYSQTSSEKPKKLADDVYYMALPGGSMYYMSDVDHDTYEGTLHVGTEKADDDVSALFVPISQGKDASIYYAKNYSYDNSSFTLCRYQKGKTVKIDDDVFCFKPFENGEVAYMQDYNKDKLRGSLYLWSGDHKQAMIDDNVTYLQGSYGALGFIWLK